MSRVVRLILLTASLMTAFLAGSWITYRTMAKPSPTGRRILYYHDPMHPDFRSDKPGIAPDCGMPLEPVYADGGSGDSDRLKSMPFGSVRITAEKQQLIGVQVEAVQQMSGVHSIRTVGRVATDDRRIYRLNTSASGWIRETFSNSVGSLVRKDEALATFYTREFLTAQQAYFYALDALDRFTAMNVSEQQLATSRAQVQAAVDALQALGMSDVQIAQLATVRKASQQIELRSPVTGFVLERNVSPGQRFEAGDELYVIADLSEVWILADMFQYEASAIRAGQVATVELPHQGERFRARVSEVLPQFDPSSRTLKVRLETHNPGFVLRPDMFVDVEFPLRVPSVLTVPADAVLDSGLRKTVFVDAGDGYFEPRRVESGRRIGDRVEIRSGLMDGERVVTAGNFLLDSESRLRAATAGIRSEPAKDLVCGMDVDPSRARAAKRISRRDGIDYFFCSDRCKQSFDADPARFMPKPKAGPGPTATVHRPGRTVQRAAASAHDN